MRSMKFDENQCSTDHKNSISIFFTFSVSLNALLHKNVLNDVTAAPFSVSFSLPPAEKNHGAAVRSFRTFVFHYGFR